MVSPHFAHSSLYSSQVQPTEYSPSPRKYHVASRSHSPAGDRLVDSMLGKDTDNVIRLTTCSSLSCCEIDLSMQGLLKLGVTKTDLDTWTEKCRKVPNIVKYYL